MSMEETITRGAIKVGREVVGRGVWRRFEGLTEVAAAEISRFGTLWFVDLGALEELLGRKLSKNDHWLWETTLRAELRRLAPVALP